MMSKDQNDGGTPYLKRLREEKELLKNGSPSRLLHHAQYVRGGRWPQAEKLILKDLSTALEYAQNVLKSRWPDLETLILDRREYFLAYLYALYVIKDRWLEAESFIPTTPETAVNYAHKVIKGQWPEAEEVIKQSPFEAVRYAGFVKGKWPEAEAIILTDPRSAYKYAVFVLEKRWLEAEPFIFNDPDYKTRYLKMLDLNEIEVINTNPLLSMIKDYGEESLMESKTIDYNEAKKSPYRAYKYAAHVVHKRCPELETIILKDPMVAATYARDVLKARWPELEPILLNHSDGAVFYSRFILKARWPEAEKEIIYNKNGQDNNSTLMSYIENVVEGRLLEAEPEIIRLSGRILERYLNYNRITLEDMVSTNPLLSSALNDRNETLLEMKETSGSDKNAFTRDKEYENKLLSSDIAYDIGNYIFDHLKTRWIEAEPIIKRSPLICYRYAHEIIKGRWPEAEETISSDLGVAYLYVMNVMGEPWKEIEQDLIEYLSPIELIYYCRRIRKCRLIEAENRLFRERKAKPLYQYADLVVRGRWPDAETIIATDAEAAYLYATWVIDGRFPLAEKTILASEQFKGPYLRLIGITEEEVLETNPEATELIDSGDEDLIEGQVKNRCKVIFENKEVDSDPKNDFERKLLDSKDPWNLVKYCLNNRYKRWPEAEPIIKEDPRAAKVYAHRIIKGRWPEAEPFILKDINFTYHYAMDVINEPWPEGENVLMGEAYYAAKYAIKFGKRFYEAEPAILDDQGTATYYFYNIKDPNKPDVRTASYEAFRQYFMNTNPIFKMINDTGEEQLKEEINRRNILEASGKKKKPKLKHIDDPLFRDPDKIVEYAIVELNGRWPEGEKRLLEINDAVPLVVYAMHAIKGRWPEAEFKILNSPYNVNYARYVIKGRWPELEKEFLKNRFSNDLADYIKLVVKERWPEAEEALLNDPDGCVEYAIEILNKRWLEAEPVMLDTDYIELYLEHFGLTKEELISTNPYFNVINDHGEEELQEALINKKRVVNEDIDYDDEDDDEEYDLEDDDQDSSWIDPYETLDHMITNDYSGEEIATFIADNIGSRVTDAEELILDDSNGIIIYARDVIRGRWISGEEVLLQNYNKGQQPSNDYYQAINDYIREVINADKLVDDYIRWSKAEPIILSSKKPQHIIDYAISTASEFIAGEPIIMQSARDIVRYAVSIKGRWREAESSLLESSHYPSIINYSKYVIKSRWPEAEDRLLNGSDIESLCVYASDVINGRWLEAEPRILSSNLAQLYLREMGLEWDEAIATNPYFSSTMKSSMEDTLSEGSKTPSLGLIDDSSGVKNARALRESVDSDEEKDYLLKNGDVQEIFEYCINNEERWPEVEHLFVDDPTLACAYARFCIKGRWPKAESNILKYPSCAYDYATEVIGGRWPEAEPIIINDLTYIVQYARYIIKGRWPEAEVILKNYPVKAFAYAHEVIRGRWLEAEDAIMTDPQVSFNYARFILKSRWPEAEEYISGNGLYSTLYAEIILKDRFPEAEAKISSHPTYAMEYAKRVIGGRWLEAEPTLLRSDEATRYLNFIGMTKEEAISSNEYLNYFNESGDITLDESNMDYAKNLRKI